jgi:hypothetical protein
MEEMVEGTRVHTRRNGTFVAEVVVNRRVVWRRQGYRSQQEAQAEADRKWTDIKRNR